MEKELIVALLSGAVSFFVFLKLMQYLNRIFSIEIPDFLGFILGLLLIAGLYIKKDFFFGSNPIITGVTIGIMLSLLWDIKNTGFITSILKTVISFRFFFWAASTAAGIYKRQIVLDLWSKYVVVKVGTALPYIMILIIILYILGTIFMLFPEPYVKNRMKNNGFSMVKRVPKSRKIITQCVGLLIVLISSTLILEAVTVIHTKFF